MIRLRAPGAAEDFTVRSVTTDELGVWYHVYNTSAHPATAHTFALALVRSLKARLI